MKRRESILKYYMYTMSILLCMTSCHWFEMEEEIIYDRTVLVYMAADNNLSYIYSGTTPSFFQQDITEMITATGNIPGNSRLLVYVDDTDLPRILSVEQQKGRRPIAKVLHQYDSEHNSGDAETLRLALEWTIDNFPAKSYGLVLWSHGDAWLPAKAPAQRAVCLDSKSNTWMEIADIANTLAAFPRMEFILFDACFMQSIEVAYELRNATKYIIGSPAEIPAPGAPYNRIMSAMFSSTNCSENIADAYYQEYLEGNIPIIGHEPYTFGVCLSVISCDQMDQLAEATKQMVTKYATPKSAIDLIGVQRYFLKTSATRPEYYDINGYMQRLITNPDDYLVWHAALEKAITLKRNTGHWFSDHTGMEHVDTDNYSGVSCYVPKDDKSHASLNTKFHTTSWYTAAGWQQAGW